MDGNHRVGFIHDIAVRCRAKPVSRSRGTTYRLLFTNSRQGVVLDGLIFDDDGNVVD